MGSGATTFGRRPQRARQYSQGSDKAKNSQSRDRTDKDESGRSLLLSKARSAVQEQVREQAALLVSRWTAFENCLWPCFRTWQTDVSADSADLLRDLFRSAIALRDSTDLGLALAKAARLGFPIGSRQIQTALDSLLAQEEREGLVQCLGTSLRDADSLSAAVWLEEADSKGLQFPPEVRQWIAAASADSGPTGRMSWQDELARDLHNLQEPLDEDDAQEDSELAGLLGFGADALLAELLTAQRAARAAAAERRQREDDGIFRRWSFDEPLFRRGGAGVRQQSTGSSIPGRRRSASSESRSASQPDVPPETWREPVDPRPSARSKAQAKPRQASYPTSRAAADSADAHPDSIDIEQLAADIGIAAEEEAAKAPPRKGRDESRPFGKAPEELAAGIGAAAAKAARHAGKSSSEAARAAAKAAGKVAADCARAAGRSPADIGAAARTAAAKAAKAAEAGPTDSHQDVYGSKWSKDKPRDAESAQSASQRPQQSAAPASSAQASSSRQARPPQTNGKSSARRASCPPGQASRSTPSGVPPQDKRRSSSSSGPPPKAERSDNMTDARTAAMQCLALPTSGTLTSEALRQAYKKAALRWHPDRPQNHNNGEEATRKFQEVRAAFDLLQRGMS